MSEIRHTHTHTYFIPLLPLPFKTLFLAFCHFYFLNPILCFWLYLSSIANFVIQSLFQRLFSFIFISLISSVSSHFISSFYLSIYSQVCISDLWCYFNPANACLIKFHSYSEWYAIPFFCFLPLL